MEIPDQNAEYVDSAEAAEEPVAASEPASQVVPPPAPAAPVRGPEAMPVVLQEALEVETPAFDWLTEVAIPLGIFGMLGCLVCFLIEWRDPQGSVLGNGLRMFATAFLAATVGIARLRLWFRAYAHSRYASELRVYPYLLGVAVALVAGYATWDFTLMHGDGAFIHAVSDWGPTASFLLNLLLLALVWWVADRVTRECTLEENFQYALSQGIYTDLADGVAVRRNGRRSKAHHPGRAVLWVSVFAVICFGLAAHSLGDERRFDRASWYVAGYTFFALFLLALTNLSAIRMDVRRRRLAASRGLTPTWIATSLALVMVIAFVALPLPRGPGFGPARGELYQPPDWVKTPSAGLQTGPSWGFAQSHPESSSAPGLEPETSGRGAAADAGTTGQSGSSGGGQGTGASGGGGSGGQGASAGGGGGGGGGGGQDNTQTQSSGASGGGADSAQGRMAAKSQGSGVRQNWWWLLLLLLLAILIYLLIRYREQVMAALRAMAAPFYSLWLALLALLERLRRWLGFGRRREDEFSDLPEDPFADIWDQRDLAANLTAAQIVRHVYRAFMAFCGLRGYPRLDYQTEKEFLHSVPSDVGVAEEDSQGITSAYVFATYSPNEVGRDLVDQARDIWSRLRPAIDATLGRRPTASSAASSGE
ncbi:DUF4129 domain-containing protein [bacterium]|nr:DUF4129 domain-containing protein [bacterium]